jgi:uncharacterized coiled-coil protein SlyX
MSAAIHSIDEQQPAEATTRTPEVVVAHYEAMIATLKAQVAVRDAEIAELRAQMADERKNLDGWHRIASQLTDVLEREYEATARSLSRKGLSD